ncbi:MAG: hypothetical protein EOO90_08630 [Pedobacter sp.]|nr:MAG: hypothetical protein EOO90_08630 [Pedobacter sp.]
MNDPLKKYVHEHRDEFDHLEPSAALFSKLKNELKNQPKPKKGIMVQLVNYKWIAAACLTVSLSVAYLFVSRNEPLDIDSTQATLTTKKETEKAVKSLKQPNDLQQVVLSKTVTKPKKAVKKNQQSIDLLNFYRDLTDSTSASKRLAAILSIERSKIISYDIIDRLTTTLSHDSNSNVRLAALNLMSKFSEDNYVNNALTTSLSHQKDPLLQLGLIDILRQTDNPKLDDKLYALANDPSTLSEVKDLAYLVLLNQNKL